MGSDALLAALSVHEQMDAQLATQFDEDTQSLEQQYCCASLHAAYRVIKFLFFAVVSRASVCWNS